MKSIDKLVKFKKVSKNQIQIKILHVRNIVKYSVIAFISIIAIILIVIASLNSNINQKNNKTETKTDKNEENPTEDLVLRLLIWEGHAPDQHTESFEKFIEEKYGKGIKLENTYVTSSDDFYDSIRGGKVDLVMMTHHHFKDQRFDYISNKLLIPLDLKNIPNFKNIIPALQNAEYLKEADDIYASPVSQGPYGLAYNSDLLDEEPQSWNIFWDSRFKDKYVIGLNEYSYNITITALALGYPRESINDYEFLNNDEFKNKLKQLADNAHSFWIGVDKPGDLSGMTVATSWGDSIAPLNEMGENWKIAEPFEGSPSWIDNYAITWSLAEKPLLKKIAEEYINSRLSIEYQIEHIMHHMSLTPIITNITEELTEYEKACIHVGYPNFFEENRILQPTYSERTRNGLKLLWDQAIRDVFID